VEESSSWLTLFFIYVFFFSISLILIHLYFLFLSFSENSKLISFTCLFLLSLMDGYFRNWSSFVASSHCYFAIILPRVSIALLCSFDLVVGENKFSLICLFLKAIKLTPFHNVINVHLISYHFVFQFLHFIVFIEHACLLYTAYSMQHAIVSPTVGV
jgi:hypothetical protein